MTTLESIIEHRMKEYHGRIANIPELRRKLREDPSNDQLRQELEVALQHEREFVDYALQTMPFIQQLQVSDDHLETDAPTPTAAATPNRTHGQGKGLDAYISERQVSNRSELFVEYMRDVEGKFIEPKLHPPTRDVYVCDCGGDREFAHTTSMLTCVRCGKSEYHMEMSTRNLSYLEEISTSANQPYAYQRINHFSDWLNSIQGKEHTEVPQEVIDAIKAEFRKEGCVTRSEIKPSKVRGYLKKLNLSKYYEHTNHITSLLNGVPPPIFPKELEDKLKAMFKAVQEPFRKHCPKTRKNFLSYKYTLYKFCELLGEDQYKKHFPLLKSAAKLHAQDVIFKAICQELGWQFIPSV